MLWFRKHLRYGSWLALFALTINFMLAFGHVHAPDGTLPERQVTLIAASAATNGSGQSQSHPGHHADYLCPICMAVTAMGNALATTPPALPVEFAVATSDRATNQSFSAPQSPRAAFSSRGPPIS